MSASANKPALPESGLLREAIQEIRDSRPEVLHALLTLGPDSTPEDHADARFVAHIVMARDYVHDKLTVALATAVVNGVAPA